MSQVQILLETLDYDGVIANKKQLYKPVNALIDSLLHREIKAVAIECCKETKMTALQKCVVTYHSLSVQIMLFVSKA